MEEIKRKWYTPAEIAKIVFEGHVTVGTVRQMINRGEIPCYKVGSDTDAGGRPIRRKMLVPASYVLEMERKALGANG